MFDALILQISMLPSLEAERLTANSELFIWAGWTRTTDTFTKLLWGWRQVALVEMVSRDSRCSRGMQGNWGSRGVGRIIAVTAVINIVEEGRREEEVCLLLRGNWYLPTVHKVEGTRSLG